MPFDRILNPNAEINHEKKSSRCIWFRLLLYSSMSLFLQWKIEKQGFLFVLLNHQIVLERRPFLNVVISNINNNSCLRSLLLYTTVHTWTGRVVFALQ